MKQNELQKRINYICNYIIGGIAAETLRAKYKALCKARARALEIELELKAILDKYE